MAVSIVLALGLVRLVDGLANAVSSASRYWVHISMVLAMIGVHLFYW